MESKLSALEKAVGRLSGGQYRQKVCHYCGTPFDLVQKEWEEFEKNTGIPAPKSRVTKAFCSDWCRVQAHNRAKYEHLAKLSAEARERERERRKEKWLAQET